MNRTTISIAAADGGSFSGYLAVPVSGSGPGLILLQEIFGINEHIREIADVYAAEGYVVLAPDLFWRIKPGVELGYSDEEVKTALSYSSRFDIDRAIRDIGDALRVLRADRRCTARIGALGFCLGGKLAYLSAARLPLDAAVSYYGVGMEQNLAESKSIRCPIALHFAAEDQLAPAAVREAVRQALAGKDDAEIYVYRGADHSFNNRHRESYHAPSASLAYGRTISLLRRALGPRYPLEALWEKHLEGEFVTCDPEATMRTMGLRPYVNHVPTMSGGLGREQLYRYYKYHFIPQNQGSQLIPVSRTIGANTLVDEFVACFNHDHENDTILPGVKPTGKTLRIPMVAIVQFRGDKLCSERLYWDQAAVLAQVGLLDPSQLPVTGAEAAEAVLDQEVALNTLRADQWWKQSEAKN